MLWVGNWLENIYVLPQDERIGRDYGYSFKGTRAIAHRLFVRSPRTSVVAAIGVDDFRCLKTFSGSVNAEKFLQFVNQELVPILQPYDGLNGSSVVIMGKKLIV